MLRSAIYVSIIFSCFTMSNVFGQTEEDVKNSDALLEFEKRVDEAVVTTDLSFLQNAYADDFRFKHSTGLLDGKSSWLKDVEKNRGKFISRKLDSVEVEIHDNVGITNGTLTVTRKDRVYSVKYVRVYVRKNDAWQMIMHRSVQEVK